MLWVVRHAKAEHSPRTADFDRSVRRKGHGEAERMQRWLAAQPDPASLVVSSAARRAVETAQYVVRGFALSVDALATDEELYGASAEALLRALRQLPPGTGNVALVGHNPGVSDLVGVLIGSSSVDLPTCGIAALTCPAPWSDLFPSAAELALVATPDTVSERYRSPPGLDALYFSRAPLPLATPESIPSYSAGRPTMRSRTLRTRRTESLEHGCPTEMNVHSGSPTSRATLNGLRCVENEHSEPPLPREARQEGRTGSIIMTLPGRSLRARRGLDPAGSGR